MNQIEKETKIQGKKLDVIETIVTKQTEVPENNEIVKLKEQIQELREMLQNNTEQLSAQSPDVMPQQEVGLKKHVINLDSSKSLGTIKSIIPAGSFVKALVMSSVDASVGINVSADPQPVMMRILDQGKLPNNFSSRLKRCVLIGSSKGDLSSERVFIRFEKLSCIDQKTREVIETDVAGYIVGEDGKNGIKGIVKDRSGRMVGNAMFSGFLSGTSQFLQTAIQARSLGNITNSDGKGGVQNNLLSPDLFKAGGTQGVTNAFDKLADYYIKRAEQLQPVIEISAGCIVNGVFTKSVRIGNRFVQRNENQGGQGA